MTTTPNATLRLFAPPRVFRGKTGEDLDDWLHLYERYGRSLARNDEQKADALVFVLEDAARGWYVTARREETPETWEDWRKALQNTFAGDHMQAWAYISLQGLYAGNPGGVPCRDLGASASTTGAVSNSTEILYTLSRQETPTETRLQFSAPCRILCGR